MRLSKNCYKKCRICESQNYFLFDFKNLYFPGKEIQKWNNIYCKTCGSVSHFVTDDHSISYENGSYRDRNIKNIKVDNQLLKVLPPLDPWSIQSYKRWINIYSNLKKYTDAFNASTYLDHLDYGGYNGFLSHALEQLVQIKSTVADLDKRGLLIASSLGYKTINLSYDNLPKDKKYDLITLIHVLEHIEEPKKILLDLKKCLKKNGILYIEVPNLFGSPMLGDIHLSSFTLDALKNNLLNLDFQIIKSGYSHSDKGSFDFGIHYISDTENVYIICIKNDKLIKLEFETAKTKLYKDKGELIRKLNYEYSRISIKSISKMHLKKILLHLYYFSIFFFPALMDFMFSRFFNGTFSYLLFKPLKSLKEKFFLLKK